MARASPQIAALLALPDESRAIGPFMLVRQLGSGGFAPVWLAKEMYGGTELRTAAVKLFAFEHDGNSEHRNRVIDEARALCRVEHPNIVRFYSMPTDSARGVMGLAMEHVDGAALNSSINQRGKLSVAETLAVGVSVASALAAIHRSGLVHRDVKPANVIEQAGTFKLIDFGIASAERTTERAAPRKRVVLIDDIPLEVAHSNVSMLGSGVTVGGSSDPFQSLTGTMGYIDPERVAAPGQTATPAGDLYGLGAMLFECVTGTLPAVAGARLEGASGLKGDVLDGRQRAPSLGAVQRDLPGGLVRVVDSLLEPKATDRPRSAENVARELERVRGELSGRQRKLPAEEIGPFRGFLRFEESDRDVFFGRRAEIAAILETLRVRGVVALVGSSGVGKSSLARAAIIPAVRDGELFGWPKAWDVAVVDGSRDDALREALRPLVGEIDIVSEEQLSATLTDRVQTTGRGLLFVIDPLDPQAGHADTITTRLLARLGEQPLPGLRALVTVRQDLLKDVLAIPRLGRQIVAGAMLVAPLSEAAWTEVLDEALAAYGYTYDEPQLRTDILAGLRNTAMPLAQFALSRLWEKRDKEKKRLTTLAFLAMDGVAGALEKYADKTIEKLVSEGPDQKQLVHRVLLSLTTASGTRAARGRDDLSKLGDAHRVQAIIGALTKARLIVEGAGGLTLAHDSLVTHWTSLRGLVAAAREDRQRAEDVERAAGKWLTDQDPSRLWRQRQLAGGGDLLRNGHVELSDGAKLFLRTGRSAERRGRALLAFAGLLILAAGSATGVYALASAREQAAAAKQKADDATTKRAAAEQAQQDAERKQKDAEMRVTDADIRTIRCEANLAKAKAPAIFVYASPTAAPSATAAPCPPSDPLCYLTPK